MSTDQPTKKISMTLVDITRHNVGQLKLLNKSVLPVQYSEKHYAATVSNWPRENPYCRLAYHNEYLVGAINSRVESFDPENRLKYVKHYPPGEVLVQPKKRKKDLLSETGTQLHYRLHITTLSVLEAYRGAQIGTTLMKDILSTADNMHTDFDEIVVYVHVENKKAVEFYKKFGFVEIGLYENYYKEENATPPNAIVLARPTTDPKAAAAAQPTPE